MTPQERADIEALADQAVAEQHTLVVNVRAVMLTPLEEPARGYCTPCNLPSLLSWQVAFEVGPDFTIRTVSVCTDCGEESAE